MRVRGSANMPYGWPNAWRSAMRPCAKLVAMADDPDMRVRYQLAFSLGEFDDPGRTAALATIARRDAGDPWMRLAVFSSLDKGAGALFATLAADKTWRASDAGRGLLGELARYIGRQHRREAIARLMTTIESLANDEPALVSAVLRGLGEGLAKGPGALRSELANIGSGRGEKILNDILVAARLRAADETQSAAARVDAIRLLALGAYAPSAEVLAAQLTNRQGQEVQSAAVATLAKFSDPAIADVLLAAWPSLSPRLRAETIEALFSRGPWLAALVEAAEQGTFHLGDLEPARLKSLETHPNAELRKRAAPLVAKVKLGRRQDVVEAYRGVLDARGDISRGRQVFQKICASCHRLEGVGHEIGPNLASFRNRGAEAILVNVLDPNREVNPQYINYVLITDDGRSLTGLVAGETASGVTLRRGDDASDTVPRANIEELRATGLSIMPEGIEKQIDQQAMADLLSYLMNSL